MSTTAVSEPEPIVAPRAAGMLGLAERGLLPDIVVRAGIRRLCARRLASECADDPQSQAQRYQRLIEQLRRAPIALDTDAANAQHYELPQDFFRLCLGRHMKYSSCYYPTGMESLDQAEEAMLGLYAQRAQFEDGQDILELGCGWGSLTLWMAERYPHAHITAVSNSHSQRAYIQAQCHMRRLANVHVITCDVNVLALAASGFDRCVSIEMFEHMRNYDTLLARIACWLRPQGKLFVHIFAHRTLMYPFETAGEDNWMGRHFFTGGLMPATDTLLWFQRDLQVEQHWQLDWYPLRAHRESLAAESGQPPCGSAWRVDEVLRRRNASLWFQRWRMFWMACAELFGYDGGREWLVAHYRFSRPD
jgi:cyclopropane-fatty-acyl-phospholipid synthase